MKNFRLYSGLAAALFLPAALQAQAALGYTIKTIAGNGNGGYGGDGGSATSALLNQPIAAVFVGGSLYIADQVNNRIRFVNTSGTINTVAGTGTGGFNQYTGQAITDQLNFPSGVAVDQSGNLYIADTDNCGVVKVTTGGVMSLYAGSVGTCGYGGDFGPALGASLFHPSGLALDSSGNLYIADTSNNAVRKVTAATGVITTLVGNGTPGYLDGLLGKGLVNNPEGVAVDSAGNVYVADTNNHVVREITGNSITTLVGTGVSGSSPDGLTAKATKLVTPRNVAVDSAGNVYIADSSDNRVRVMTASTGLVSTIAGVGTAGYSGDGGPAALAQLQEPCDVSLDSAGNVYISDTANSVIRMLTPITSVTTGGAPVVTGVATASAFGAFNALTAGPAPGSWIEIYGTNLAVDTRTWTGKDFNGITAPTSLDGTSVSIGGQAAPVFFISAGQLDAQVPANAAGGPSVVVTTAAGTSAGFQIQINPIQPGLYAPPQFVVGGKQYIGAVLSDNVTYVMPPGAVAGFTSRQAHPGETIIMYGVGFGAVTSASGAAIPVAGQIVQTANSVPTFAVFFGQTQAVVNYAGLAPGAVGLYQFNVVVPNIANSDTVKLTFTLDNTSTTQALYTAVHN